VKVAIISDIHGNLGALEAVMSDIERRGGVDKTVCLGDVAEHGPQPREVIELLRINKWPCVMGNTDEALAKNVAENPGPEVPVEERRRILRLHAWTRKQVSGSSREFLSMFKPTVEFHSRGGQNFLFYHGSPRSNLERIHPELSDEKLRQCFVGQKTGVFVGGHTHAQMLRRVDGSVVINPGSVGLPFEQTSSGRILHPARAEYAMVSSIDGILDVELLAVSYPLSNLEKTVRRSGVPDPDRWLSKWY
jgi:putative phosphoesterase